MKITLIVILVAVVIFGGWILFPKNPALPLPAPVATATPIASSSHTPEGQEISPLVTIRDILWRDDINVYSIGAPGDSITFIGNLGTLTTIPKDGDQYGDGIWLSNGTYSANLYKSVTSSIFNGDENDFVYASIPKTVCPGIEINSCSANKAVSTPLGDYFIYIKVASGTFKTPTSSFQVVAKVSPSSPGHENYQ